MSTKPKDLPSQGYLKDCFDYNPETGELVWRARPLHHFVDHKMHLIVNGKYANTVLKPNTSDGYIGVTINNRRALAHRLIWKLVTGQEPPSVIDHKDGNPGNNAWVNLRGSDKPTNAANRGSHPLNTSGQKGVYWVRRRGNWQAKFVYYGKRIHIGTFASKAEATEAYLAKAKEIHGDFYREV